MGLPFGEAIVPQIRTVAGEAVTSTSHLRIASTSPMRANVPTCQRAEHDLDDLLQLAIRGRACEPSTSTPTPRRRSTRLRGAP